MQPSKNKAISARITEKIISLPVKVWFAFIYPPQILS